MADLSRHPVLFLLAAALIFLGGCELVGGLVGDSGHPNILEVANQTDNSLYIQPWTEEALSMVRLAHAVDVDPGDPNLIGSGEQLDVPLDEFGEGFGRGDALVFVIYEPAGGNRYHIATLLRKSYDELRSRGFRVVIQPEDLAHEHLFGDEYFVVTDEDNAGPKMHPPGIEDGTLSLWVGFGGCSDGSFTLSESIRDGEAKLAVGHNYPDLEVDCDRLNYEELSFQLSQEVLAQERIVLLNPNRGADPYAHAFLLRGNAQGREIAFEVHLNDNFDDDRVRVELDGQEVFEGRVTTNYVLSLAEVVKVDALSGRHRIDVEVNDDYTASETFFLDRPLFFQVHFYTEDLPQYGIREGIQIDVSDTRPMYD